MVFRVKHLRRLALLALTVYWVALFVGTHVPGGTYSVQVSDKLLHLGGYTGLSFLVTAVMVGSWPRLRLVLLSFAVVVSYGALDELSQVPIPGRIGDPMDWLADVGGAVLGILAYFVAWFVLQQWRGWTPDTVTPMGATRGD